MIAALLLSEDWFAFPVLLLRTAVLLLSAGTVVLSLNRRSFWHRVAGLLLAAFLALLGFTALGEPSPYREPTGRYVVAALGVPVLIGLGATLFFPRQPPQKRP